MAAVKDMTVLTGISVLHHLDPDLDVPVIGDAPACQGDVSILPSPGAADAVTPMPVRVDVVRGEAGGNTHSLTPAGPCYWDAHSATSPTDLRLGTLTVPDGSTAVLGHPEHGFMEIAPGTYQIGRQREWAGEWAYVAD